MLNVIDSRIPSQPRSHLVQVLLSTRQSLLARPARQFLCDISLLARHLSKLNEAWTNCHDYGQCVHGYDLLVLFIRLGKGLRRVDACAYEPEHVSDECSSF